MLSKLEQIEERLAALAKDQDSLDWFRRSVDIFHDAPTAPGLAPIGSNTTAVAVPQTFEATFGRPDGLAEGETWSCLIFTAPLASAHPSTYAWTTDLQRQLYNYAGDTVPFELRPVNVARCKTGGNFLPYISASGIHQPNERLNTAWTMPEIRPQLGDQYQVQSCGFEIVNLTKVLERGGQVLGGKFDSNSTYETMDAVAVQEEFPVPTASASVDAEGYCHIRPHRRVLWAQGPPPNERLAANVNNSIVIPAERGCYCMAPLDVEAFSQWHRGGSGTFYQGQGLQPCDITSSHFCSYGIMTSVPSVGGQNEEVGGYADVNFGTAGVSALVGLDNTDPFSGAFKARLVTDRPLYEASTIGGTFACFTGLTYETVLKLRVRMIFAIQPSNQSSLFTLTRPIPQRNQPLLDLLTEVQRHLPPIVGQDENPDGEWWNTVLGVVKKVAPYVSGAAELMFPEFAAPIAAGTAAIDKAIDSKLAKYAKADAAPTQKNVAELAKSMCDMKMSVPRVRASIGAPRKTGLTNAVAGRRSRRKGTKISDGAKYLARSAAKSNW